MTTFIILLCVALLVLGAVFFGIELILYILGGLILLIIAVMLIPITLDIKAEDELRLTLKILFLRFRLAPKKEKPIKLSDYKIYAFRKKRLKEQKKYFLKRKRPSKSGADTGKKEKPKKSLNENAQFILDLLKHVILGAMKKFGSHFRMNFYYLRIKVGGDEPDKTALTYGYICQSVSYITKLINRHMNVRYPGRTENRIYVGADFSSPKTEIRLHIAFRIKVWQITSVLMTALLGYLRMPKREPKLNMNKENKPAKAGTEV